MLGGPLLGGSPEMCVLQTLINCPYVFVVMQNGSKSGVYMHLFQSFFLNTIDCILKDVSPGMIRVGALYLCKSG